MLNDLKQQELSSLALQVVDNLCAVINTPGWEYVDGSVLTFLEDALRISQQIYQQLAK